MKKLIRLLGTALLVAGMGIGGTALTAGAASADTGTQAASLQLAGNSWSNGDNCRHWNDSWNSEGRNWNDDKCRDDHNRHGDHRDRDHNGDHNGDHRDHNGDGNRRHC